eukprot:scaffold617_cov161-Pinguiococcus_pyrenoidosus.AAC.4
MHLLLQGQAHRNIGEEAESYGSDAIKQAKSRLGRLLLFHNSAPPLYLETLRRFLFSLRPLINQRQVARARVCLDSFSLGGLFKASSRALQGL